MANNEKQETIIKAALEVFCNHGFSKTRMADVARKAGVSYGLVYHYFGSKEVLFDTIVNMWWRALYGVLEEQKASTDDFPKKLIKIVEFFFDTYQDNPNLISIFVTEVSRSSIYRTSRGLEKFRKFFSLCEEIMKQGQDTGFLRNDIKPHYLTYVFLGGIEAFISILVLGKEPLNRSRKNRAMDAIIKVFLEGAKI